MNNTILYIHGFASSGASGTVKLLRDHFYSLGIQVVAPDVPIHPLEAVELLRKTVDQTQPDLIIGTSMGGMYASLLNGTPRILVNPSFYMSKTLVFKKMVGRNCFLNKREDGATEFVIDKQIVAEYAQLEKELLFNGIDDKEKQLVYGLFGKNDKFVNYQKEYIKHFGKEHFELFDGEHQLNDKALKTAVLPKINLLLHTN